MMLWPNISVLFYIELLSYIYTMDNGSTLTFQQASCTLDLLGGGTQLSE